MPFDDDRRSTSANDHGPQDIIELSSSDDDDDEDGSKPSRGVDIEERTERPTKTAAWPNLAVKGKPLSHNHPLDSSPAKKKKRERREWRDRSLQGGLVLEEVVETLAAEHNICVESKSSDEKSTKVTVKSYVQKQEHAKARGSRTELYHDPEFESSPSSIEGSRRTGKIEKCRCSPGQPVELAYISKGPNTGRPYYRCAKTIKSTRCQYFRWAFQAERMHWYRFGRHTGHVLVQDQGFSASDLLQGKVGDCWFLSALAVIAERPDLIMRLFGNDTSMNPYGIVNVYLFLDGFWKTVVMDNFLPCIIDDKAEGELQQALSASLGNGHVLSGGNEREDFSSSRYDPFILSDKNRQVLSDTQNILDRHQKRTVNPYSKRPPIDVRQIGQSGSVASTAIPRRLNRIVTTEDLAYSKAKKQQLWVPFLEKAYAKAHGSYHSISGGYIAEAFLDLTGAPTKVFHLHNSPDFDAREFWYQLLTYRRQRLPMGCGTDSSQAGIVGMHAYSILDVREIRNVDVGFFREKLQDRSLGNVSGFTEFDGTVRLLRIRNPHGRGEWQGEFSDRSDVWEKLLRHTQTDTSLERTMQNDGTFWIDYDCFLLGFANVDVVLAFTGNHAKSFHSHFPLKQSTHRCTKAFEVSLLDVQPGVPSKDRVELYVMGIQKTRRGASHGRVDRKVSYKICDMGILVGENLSNKAEHDNAEEFEFNAVEGEMFGFKRNGHYRLILDGRKNKRLVVMPVNFGHPAATDKERSFAVRFVADAPLLIRELPSVPRMDKVLCTYCFEPFPSFRDMQRKRKILLEDAAGIQKYGEPLYRIYQVDCLANDGGVVFIYLCVNDRLIQDQGDKQALDLNISCEITCRGMMCRTERGFLTHKTIAKGKKFEASWRKFETGFYGESKTRLLFVLVQSGQDSEMGTIKCQEDAPAHGIGGKASPKKQTKLTQLATLSSEKPVDFRSDFEIFGIFASSNYMYSKEQHAAIFGPSSIQGPASHQMPIELFDIDLEKALASSRGDVEIKDVLELSKQDSGPLSSNNNQRRGVMLSEEEQVRLALEQSKVEAGNARGTKIRLDGGGKTGSTQTVENADLEQAIRLSLQENKATESKADVIDIEGDEDEDMTGLPSFKKQKMSAASVAELNTASAAGNKSIRDSEMPSTKYSLEEKRRLAAKAAMKRFQSRAT